MEGLKEIIDYGVIGLLGVMLLISTVIYFERLIYFAFSYEPSEHSNVDRVEIELGRGISWIATIGSNAPYIGLLGTVLGIMLTFYSMGEVGTVETKVIMTGLALALKATAAGLIVAIPSIIFYNHLVRKIEVKMTEWKEMHERHQTLSKSY
jgi:biopolymer transport protein ExbB